MMELWTLAYASYDGKRIGTGCGVYFTEYDAVESLREDMLSNAIDDLDMGAWENDAEWEKAKAETGTRVAKMTFEELQAMYEERYGDMVQTVTIQKHDVTPPAPVPTTVEGIEAFLDDQPKERT